MYFWVFEKGKRIQHIDVRFHMCWEAVNIGEVKLKYCPSTETMEINLAKPLRPQKFKAVKNVILMTVSFYETM